MKSFDQTSLSKQTQKISATENLIEINIQKEYYDKINENDNIHLQVSLDCSGSEIRLHNSRTANCFWKTANRDYQFHKKFSGSGVGKQK